MNSEGVVIERVGVGADEHAVLRTDGHELVAFTGLGDTEPRIPVIAIGEWVEMERPRNMRALAKRHAELGNIAPLRKRRTVQRLDKGGRQRGSSDVEEMYVGLVDALFLVSQSGTPKAVAATKEMIHVFVRSRDALRDITHVIDEAMMRRVQREEAERNFLTVESRHEEIERLVKRVAEVMDPRMPTSQRVGWVRQIACSAFGVAGLELGAFDMPSFWRVRHALEQFERFFAVLPQRRIRGLPSATRTNEIAVQLALFAVAAPAGSTVRIDIQPPASR